jgi:hypothetical protein
MYKLWNGWWKTLTTHITTVMKGWGISQVTLNQIRLQYEDTHEKPKKGDSRGPPLSSEIFVHTIERTTIEQHFKNRTLNGILEQHKIIFLYLWTEMITSKFISTASSQTSQWRTESQWHKSSTWVGSTRHITTYAFPNSVYFRTVWHTHINKGNSSQFL